MLRIITAKKLNLINNELSEYRQRALFAESQLASVMCENRELHGQLLRLREKHKTACMQLERQNKFIEEVKLIYQPYASSCSGFGTIPDMKPEEKIKTANVIISEVPV